MLVVQQADCEKIMDEVWVFRGQRGLLPVYVPKLCTAHTHIGTTRNVVLIKYNKLTAYYFMLTNITSSYYYSTSNSYKTFEYHTTEVQSVQIPDMAESQKTVKHRPSLPVFVE